MTLRRPGIVADAKPAAIPDQRCTTSCCTASGKQMFPLYLLAVANKPHDRILDAKARGICREVKFHGRGI
jgi:hypothetical protein